MESNRMVTRGDFFVVVHAEPGARVRCGHDLPLMAKPMHPSQMLGRVARSLQRTVEVSA
jgi:hypothetical protein